jgi:hypothetical protein
MTFLAVPSPIASRCQSGDARSVVVGRKTGRVLRAMKPRGLAPPRH